MEKCPDAGAVGNGFRINVSDPASTSKIPLSISLIVTR